MPRSPDLPFCAVSDHDNPRLRWCTNAASSFEPYESGIGWYCAPLCIPFVRDARDRYHPKAATIVVRTNATNRNGERADD
jgi:hypothetical protein